MSRWNAIGRGDNGKCGLKTDQVKRLKELEKDRAREVPLVRAQWRGSG